MTPAPTSPSRRFDPSAATTHVPPAPLTSRRPGAGSLKSAGAACSTPIVRRTRRRRRGPAARTPPRRRGHRRDSHGERPAPPRDVGAPARARAYAARTTAHARSSAARVDRHRASALLHVAHAQLLLEPVEPAPQPRVDGAARQIEQLGDLARRVLEQVAQDDHRPLLRPELASARAAPRPPSGSRSAAAGSATPSGSSSRRSARARAPVDRPVDDDPVQPGPERPPPVEAVERANRREKRLLRDVLGGGGVCRPRAARRGRRAASARERAARALRGARAGPRAPRPAH